MKKKIQKSAMNAITCGRLNPDIFEADDVAKSCSISSRTINQYPNMAVQRMAHALKTFYCRGALDTRVNLDAIGYAWTGNFDLNTLHVDRRIFESGEKKLRESTFDDYPPIKE